MMIGTNDLIEAFRRNIGVIKAQTDGLAHSDSLMQPPFRGNCMNWVVGHIASNRDQVLEALGQEPVMGSDAARYKRESEPLLDAEQDQGILQLEELLARLDTGQERIASALERIDEETLSREVKRGDRTITVAQRIFFLYFHECYHTGQTELLRQLAGKNDKVI